jgi:hypothetical protein
LAWRRPTLPCLEAQYHGRCGVSRPSSEWDRVGHPRHDHQANKTSGAPARSVQGGAAGGAVLTGNRHGQAAEVRDQISEVRSESLLISGLCSLRTALPARAGEICRAIRTGKLRASPRLHIRPIDVVVYHGSQARPGFEVGFPLRCFQRLSRPCLATRLRGWRHDRSTRGTSTPVLSY